MKQTILLLLLTISLLGGACVSTTIPQSTTDTSAISRVENGLLPAIVAKGQNASMKLADRMAFHNVPGVSIAVINGGKLDWAKGYGTLESGSTRAVTAETRFQAASISKPVAAMAALVLVEQGKLKLDEDVNLSLKSWQVPDNKFTTSEKVTVRRLLSHSAGLTVSGFPGYSANASLPTLVEILDGRKPAANTAAIRADIVPGKRFRYSGGGYTVLQQLMIDVSGKPFPDLLQELVLRKLGMLHSTYNQPLPKDLESVAAFGHEKGKSIPGHWHAYPEMAAAGLWTTPSDLALFAIDLMESAQGKPGKALSPEMARQMLSRQIGSYGLGVNVGDSKGVASFTHGGSNEGFTCILVANVNTSQGAVVMTNSDNGPALFNEILRAISHEYNWPDNRPQEKSISEVGPATLASYAGRYDADGTPVTVTLQSGQLSIQSEPMGPTAIRLYPMAEDRFFVQETAEFHVRFVKNHQGKVSALQIEAGPDRATASRVR